MTGHSIEIYGTDQYHIETFRVKFEQDVEIQIRGTEVKIGVIPKNDIIPHRAEKVYIRFNLGEYPEILRLFEMAIGKK